MNKERRKEITVVLGQLESVKELAENLKTMLESIKDEIERIKDDEEEYKDNMPESLQNSERYYAAEAAVGHLEEVFSGVEELHSALESADFDSMITTLDQARE